MSHRLGAMLRLWLASRRLTFRTAAKQIGTSPATLTRICAGKPCDVATWLKVQAWLFASPESEKDPRS